MAAGAAAVSVEREIWIDAPPSTVFSFLTDPAKMVRWMGSRAVFEARPGGAYGVNIGAEGLVRGEVVEVVERRRVVFTWGFESHRLRVPPGSSTVEIDLEPDGDGTLLRLTHRDLPAEMHAFHRFGWKHYLGRLSTVAAGGDPGTDPMAR